MFVNAGIFIRRNQVKTQDRDNFKKAKTLFLKQGGILKTKEAIRVGIHPRTLYEMLNAGVLERLNRGLYRLADLPPLGNPDLVSVSLKVPHGVICLISALHYHDITTQIPHEIYLALERGTEPPRLDHPPIRIFWFTGRAFAEGVEMHKIDGIPTHIYSPEKTVVDCFKYRNKIGLDVAIEALRECWRNRRCTMDQLWYYAKICRVTNVMRPYLESVISR
jgi:predicted transcriptional regulator of viral defense system